MTSSIRVRHGHQETQETQETRSHVHPVDGVHEPAGDVLLGYPCRELASVPGSDAAGAEPTLLSAGHFTVLSALHREHAALLPAAALARRFPTHPTAAGLVPLRDGAVHVHADSVGLTVSAQLGARTAGCLHHNYTMLLPYLQNLTCLITAPPAPEAEPHQPRGRPSTQGTAHPVVLMSVDQPENRGHRSHRGEVDGGTLRRADNWLGIHAESRR